MTYGVDECRVCGKAMKPTGPEAMQRHLASLKGRPMMTDKQWRAAGLKASPTKRQMRSPQHGCCFECALMMGQKGIGQRRWIYPTLVLVVLFILTIYVIGSRYT